MTTHSTTMAQVDENGGLRDYTEDGTVDLKGRPILRSKTGRWKACSFVLGYEALEKLAYKGVSSNLVVYLTRELGQGTVTASNNVTNWSGTIWMTPILGAYVADAHLGRFWTFLVSTFVYLMGMILLTLAVSVPGLRPPQCSTNPDTNCPKASTLQTRVFFAALYIIAVGSGASRPNVSTTGADQFDDLEPKEKAQKPTYFNLWILSVFVGYLIAEAFVVYIQDDVGWPLGYGLPTAALGLAMVLFFLGAPFYRHRLPSGSPFTKMAKVFVAALRKWNVALPENPNELYELSFDDCAANLANKIEHTPSLRFFDKAAIKRGPTAATPWTLCTVTQVEETKQILKLIPILLSTFIPATTSAQTITLFVKQGTTLDRSMGPNFQIPPASLTICTTLSLIITVVLYDRCFVPAARRFTGNPRGITMLQRAGVGIALTVAVFGAACLAERKRLAVARAAGVGRADETVPLSVFVLVPQFALVGVADAFVAVAKQEFFYEQAPKSMKSLGASFFTTGVGVGDFLSGFILKTVASVTAKSGGGGWILDNLNVSRLDYYYAFLAALVFIDFFFFLVVAKLFVYNVEPNKSEPVSIGLEILED